MVNGNSPQTHGETLVNSPAPYMKGSDDSTVPLDDKSPCRMDAAKSLAVGGIRNAISSQPAPPLIPKLVVDDDDDDDEGNDSGVSLLLVVRKHEGILVVVSVVNSTDVKAAAVMISIIIMQLKVILKAIAPATFFNSGDSGMMVLRCCFCFCLVVVLPSLLSVSIITITSRPYQRAEVSFFMGRV
jgi:hypothetical protein